MVQKKSMPFIYPQKNVDCFAWEEKRFTNVKQQSMTKVLKQKRFTNVKQQSMTKVLKQKRFKRECHQHSVFPGGHPSKYWLSSTLLDFSDQTRTGIFSVIWPMAEAHAKMWPFYMKCSTLSSIERFENEPVILLVFLQVNKNNIFQEGGGRNRRREFKPLSNRLGMPS